jgi:hypothetical protein
MSENTFPSTPGYIDGRSSVPDYIVKCHNLQLNSAPRRYMYVDDDIGIGATANKSQDPSGRHIGSNTVSGAEEGPLAVALMQYDDPVPKPGYVMELRGKYYVVSDKVGAKREKGKTVRVTLPCLEIVNPLMLGLLSETGQYVEKTATAASAMTSISAAAVNTRASATVTYAATGLPSAVTCNASTGVISGTPATAGVYEIEVVCTDTLAGSERKGSGWIRLTVS